MGNYITEIDKIFLMGVDCAEIWQEPDIIKKLNLLTKWYKRMADYYANASEENRDNYLVIANRLAEKIQFIFDTETTEEMFNKYMKEV